MSAIAALTLFVDAPQECCSECGRSLPPYVDDLADEYEEETSAYKTYGKTSEYGHDEVVAMFPGYVHKDEAESHLRDALNREYVEEAVLVGISDTSDSGWAFLIDDESLAEVNGYEGAMGNDVVGMVSEEYRLDPTLPHWL